MRLAWELNDTVYWWARDVGLEFSPGWLPLGKVLYVYSTPLRVVGNRSLGCVDKLGGPSNHLLSVHISMALEL